MDHTKVKRSDGVTEMTVSSQLEQDVHDPREMQETQQKL